MYLYHPAASVSSIVGRDPTQQAASGGQTSPGGQAAIPRRSAGTLVAQAAKMRAALAVLVTLSSIDVVAGGIVLTFSEKTALGSLSRLGGHGIARKPARPDPL
jgi:hypothetical protein